MRTHFDTMDVVATQQRRVLRNLPRQIVEGPTDSMPVVVLAAAPVRPSLPPVQPSAPSAPAGPGRGDIDRRSGRGRYRKQRRFRLR